MSTPNYRVIEVEAKEEAEPFRFEIKGHKFELPPLGPDTCPASLFAVAAREYPTEIAKVGDFLGELYTFNPDLGKVLRRLPLPYTTGLLEQWTEFSNVDPKASIS